jgi:hypothetical protein
MMGCTMPAEGAPVCTKISVELVSNRSFALYLPGDAPAPFNIAQSTNSTFRSFSTTGRGTFMWWNRGFFTPNSGGAKVLLAKGKPADVALGAEIGPGGDFGKGASYGLLFTYGKGHVSMRGGGTLLKHRGNLSLVQEGYVGFEFSKAGDVHYGWARLAVSFRGTKRKHTVTHVLGYGYESDANTAIAAGSCSEPERAEMGDESSDSQEATLAKLALGSEAVASWRKVTF